MAQSLGEGTRAASTAMLHAVDLASVESRLVDLMKDSAEPAGKPAIRARSLNLVVRCDSPEDRKTASIALTEFAHSQPARAILISMSQDDPEPGVKTAVSTNCRGVGDRTICFERIDLEASGDVRRHIGALVAPLLLGHLPTCVWWMGKIAFDDPAFGELIELAAHVAFDSGQYHGGPTGLVGGIESLRRRHTIPADFAWCRLQLWRQTLARLFDGQGCANLLRTVRGVTLEYSTAGTNAACLFLGWLASRLEWKLRDGELWAAQQTDPIFLHCHVRQSQYEIVRVCLETISPDGPGHFVVELNEGQLRARSWGDGVADVNRTAPWRQPGEAELLRSGLTARVVDEIYLSALASSVELRPLLLPARS